MLIVVVHSHREQVHDDRDPYLIAIPIPTAVGQVGPGLNIRHSLSKAAVLAELAEGRFCSSCEMSIYRPPGRFPIYT